MTGHIPEMGPVRSKSDAQRRARMLLGRLGMKAPPIDPREVAVSLGVDVVTARKGSGPASLAGAFLVHDGEPVIIVNGDHHAVRQRFTIAHELGHFLLHSGSRSQVLFRDELSSTGTSLREIQANAFAAELLMPEEMVRSRVPGPLSMFDSQRLEELAEAFQVSAHAMSIRLVNLGLQETT